MMFQVRFPLKTRALILLLVLLAGCATVNNGNSVIGSGNAQSESRTVSGFSKVIVSGSGTVNISVTGVESLTIEADDNILPFLTSDVRGGVLELGTKPNTSISTRLDPKYKLTVKSLEDITISGSASATIDTLDADKLTATISGSGSIIPSGKANNLSITISGSGSFRGDRLETQKATVVNSGTGVSILKTSDPLDVTNSGSGIVEYFGSPVLTVQNTGSGIVHQH